MLFVSTYIYIWCMCGAIGRFSFIGSSFWNRFLGDSNKLLTQILDGFNRNVSTPNSPTKISISFITDYFKYQEHSTCESYIRAETSSESSKPIPKYLEILFDENTDNIQNPYEIPLPSQDAVSVCSESLPPQRESTFEENEEPRAVTNVYENAKERLLSSCSTLSEAVI